MDILKRFIDHIHQNYLFTLRDRLLVAVSGGVDSVVLCHLCKQLGFDFAIAHCNFQLRGADSVRDESFVSELASALNVPFYTIRFDTKQYAASNKLSTQEAARDLRYDWFEKIRVKHDFDFILTAHQADDNIETVLMNFFRGTGITGLTGIRSINEKLRRPLLFARRTELEAYLNVHDLSFVQDESNLHNDYTRNLFRNEILPQIAKVYPEVQQNILNNIERMKELAVLYNQKVAEQKKRVLLKSGDEYLIPVLLLKKMEAMPTVFLEIVRPFGFKTTQLQELIRLLDSESGKYMVSTSHRILKDRKHLIISPLKELQSTAVVIAQDGSYTFVNGEVVVKSCGSGATISTDEKVACMDAAKVQYPLVLRPWRIGDYFYPLGMQKKKKLSRFFIDKKMSLADKEKVWVVEMNKKIVWVVGQRIDDRFKVTDATTDILRMDLNP